MIMDSDWFIDWYSNKATPEEIQLYDKVESFRDMFEDMVFGEDTNTRELMMTNEGLYGLDERLRYFQYNFFNYKVASFKEKNVNGSFNSSNQTLTIAPEALNDDVNILHEMIHLHEFVINESGKSYYEMALWALYQDLKIKIPKLDEIVSYRICSIVSKPINNFGGTHDLLFLLKSFDLDIRMGFPLGRVFAYGCEKDLKNYSYIKAAVDITND